MDTVLSLCPSQCYYGTLKWLSSLPVDAGVILVVKVVYNLPLPPPPYLLPPFSQSLISLMVSVDVKYHVYLLTYEEIAQVLLIGMDCQKIDSRPIFHWISRHVCQTNRRLKVAKTRSWVLPFCNPFSDVIRPESIAKVLNTSQANIFVLIIWKQRSNIVVPLGAQYRSASLHKY